MAFNQLDSQYKSKFLAYVGYVDHNGSIEDKQEEGTLESISPGTGRGLHLIVYKVGSAGEGISLNVDVPQDVLGTFKVPQIGDLVWVEESRKSASSPTTYLYSSYNSNSSPSNYLATTSVPQWGSFPGDYGHLRTYRDHNRQFLTTTEGANYVRKFIRSISGYRLRQFYRSNLAQGRYVVRGDSVFDIDGSVNEPYMVEEGAYIIRGGDLEDDQGKYPNPLNVPKEREEDEDYKYYSEVFKPPSIRLNPDAYSEEDDSSVVETEVEEHILKTKNYLSYQPVMDKEYLDEVQFEREIPAAEEYQIALRGNNKLLIQDQYGDGEQLLITLKNQYDAGITIVHNEDTGQIRIRDHLGQGVMFEANPEAPRVISWTSNRQVIEQGAVKDKGEFTYIRNGPVYGDADTNFGTKTGKEKEDVANQEFLLVSNKDIIGELGSRLSEGMNTWANSNAGVGVYMRNSTEDPSETEQKFALYEDTGKLFTKMHSKKENENLHAYETETTDDYIDTFETSYHHTNSNITRKTHVESAATSEVVEHQTLDPILGRGEIIYENRTAPDYSFMSSLQEVESEHSVVKSTTVDGDGTSHNEVHTNLLPLIGQITINRETSVDYAKETTTLINDTGDDITTVSETGVGTKINVILEEKPINDVEITEDNIMMRRYVDELVVNEVESSDDAVIVRRFTGEELVNEVESSDAGLTLTRYLDGAPESEISMSPGDLSIKRRMDTVTLNIAADGMAGPINIGNSQAPVTITGSSVDINN